MIKHIPNTITCLNLFSGCVGVWFAINGNYTGVALAIIFSAIFDFLDGAAARLLGAYSPMGKELDSLADVISFGMVPGALVFQMLSVDYIHTYAYFGFLLTIFSALRLAKFNIDERQSSSFIGLPVP
ncbi:MAG: CDP-diacylglycerol/serineO-phosphatidyltransferase, partial [Bacteroidetes bacterium]|nr:CDP-diacylglycerol/serineO-phosphatidyltransferase [Bacteroidota bacterium]